MSETASSSKSLLDAIRGRGSLHLLSSSDVSVPDARIEEIVREGILHAPSAFNGQAGRAVLLLRDEHTRFWDLAREAVREKVPQAAFESAFEPRIKLFRAAYGTILFYESQDALDKVTSQVPAVKAAMPQWSEHSTGMLQYMIWTMLCAEGLGVNLQHYSPMVDAVTAKQWNIPADWSLKAQMVFGKPAGPRIKPKDYQPVEERYKVFGA
ncbi:nitroreductase [Xylariaceae sp. FL0594]|nr:nitroreductase [Xylariaceae sp. FL0594]